MYFTILNRNVVDAYPNLEKVFNVVTYFDKKSGNNYSAIEINSLDELLSLEAVLKSTNEFYEGLRITGVEIKIIDGTV